MKLNYKTITTNKKKNSKNFWASCVRRLAPMSIVIILGLHFSMAKITPKLTKRSLVCCVSFLWDVRLNFRLIPHCSRLFSGLCPTLCGISDRAQRLPLPQSTCTIDLFNLIFGIYCDLSYIPNLIINLAGQTPFHAVLGLV